MDISHYEGVYAEIPSPMHLVLRRDTPDQPQRDKVPVIRVPTLEARGGTLFCEYEILDNDLSDEVVRALIIGPLLTDYTGRYYEAEAKNIEFLNLKTGMHQVTPYGP